MIADLAQPLTTETSHRITETLDSYLQQAHQSSNARIAALTDLPYEAGRSNPNDPSLFNLYTIDQSSHLQRQVETIVGVDVRQRPWYQQAVNTRHSGWTEPFQLGRTNLLTISAYTPVVDGANQLLGVFFANINLDQLNHFLNQVAVRQAGEVFILEWNGALSANLAGGSGPLPGQTTTQLLSGQPNLGEAAIMP